MSNLDGLSGEDRLKRILGKMKNAGREEVKVQAKKHFPALGEFFSQPAPAEKPKYGRQNPKEKLSGEDEDYYDGEEDPDEDEEYYDGEEDPDEDEEYYEGEEENGGEGDEEDEDGEEEEEDDEDDEDDIGYSLAFEDKDAAKENLSMAVAAYRMCSEFDDDFVAQHPLTGIAFFGCEDDFKEYCDQKDLNASNWKKYTSPHEIKKMDCDLATFKEVLKDLEAEDPEDAEGLQAAQDQFEKFHWGDGSKTTSLLTIPGLDPNAALTYLGVGREICYGAKKEGEFHEYYHIFGENSKVFPGVYALGDDVLVIFGGKMKVTPRGIEE